MTSIFNDDNKVSGNWWKQEKPGDEIEGTYVGKREVMNQLRGENQLIYELKTKDGEFWNVGGKPAVDSQMRHIKVGQIIGFKFIEERPSKKPGMNAAKIIQVFANPSVVDEEWLKQQEEQSLNAEAVDGEIDVSKIDMAGDTSNNAETPNPLERHDEIVALAKEKLGVADVTKVKEKVMEVTGLAYIASNHAKILEKLKAL